MADLKELGTLIVVVGKAVRQFHSRADGGIS
jgi:hypothetical protein